MNEPELKFEIDEHGCIGYRVTNEGVLLSKDEKECIIDHVMRLQAENAKLRALVADMLLFMPESTPHEYPFSDEFKRLVRVKCDALRELGIEVDE